MKFEKDGVVVVEENPNHYNIWIREGFKEVKEEVKEEVKKPKKA